jgi:hypothetical protein
MKIQIVLNYLKQEIKKAVDIYYAPDCCIAATRIALDVLEHFQIPGRPLATRLLVFNSVFREWVESHDRMPETRDEIDEVFDRGGWSLLVGAETYTTPPTGGRGFDGHLVAYLDEGYIIDLSIAQASRPRYNIRLAPLVAKMPEGFCEAGTVALQYPQKDGRDLILKYEVIDNERYLSSPDWLHDRRKIVSSQAITAIEKILRKGIQ